MSGAGKLGWVALAWLLSAAAWGACGAGGDDDSAAAGTSASGTGAVTPGAGGSGSGAGGVGIGGAGIGGASGTSSAAGVGGSSPTGESGSGGSQAGGGGAGSDGASAAGGSAAGTGAGTGGAGTGGTGGRAGTDGAPPVDLPAGVTWLQPLPQAKDVCPDPSLRLSFSDAPSVTNSGKLQVFDAAQPSQAVATVDFSASEISDMRGGQTFKLPRQVYVDGNDVVVDLKAHALSYGKSYFVTVDAGAIRGPGNAAFSITDPSAWTFSTAASAPASTTSITVALDGSGAFCSLQGALDALPNGNSAKVTIDIAAGSYHGVVYFSGKHNITLHGADRKGVVFSGVNNNNLNPATKTRALIGADDADGLIVENLTIHNLTPQGGSQAEALRLQTCDQCVVRDADILSLQDTLLWSGKVYAHNCFIAGNVDFVWGTGVVYFDACEIKTVGRSGPIVQARNAPGAYGYVFVDSRISSDAGLTGGTLGRIDVSAYPGSHVAYIDCTLGSHITAAGWTITGGAAGGSLRFWEYRSKNAAGTLIDTGARLLGSTQITAPQADSMRDKATVFGGWTPPD